MSRRLWFAVGASLSLIFSLFLFAVDAPSSVFRPESREQSTKLFLSESSATSLSPRASPSAAQPPVVSPVQSTLPSLLSRSVLPSLSVSLSASPSTSPPVMVIIAHFKEDVSWLSRQRYPYTIMVKGKPDGTPNNTPNYTGGFEAVPYVQYILDHYEDLPDRMIFLHDHEDSWHSPNVLKLLDVLDPFSYEYAGLAQHWAHCHGPVAAQMTQKWWNQSDLGRWFKDSPPTDHREYHFMCCASFLVSKQRILANPRECYQTIMDYLLSLEESDPTGGLNLEWNWHVIFGEKFKMDAPDPNKLCPEHPPTCRSNVKDHREC